MESLPQAELGLELWRSPGDSNSIDRGLGVSGKIGRGLAHGDRNSAILADLEHSIGIAVFLCRSRSVFPIEGPGVDDLDLIPGVQDREKQGRVGGSGVWLDSRISSRVGVWYLTGSDLFLEFFTFIG